MFDTKYYRTLDDTYGYKQIDFDLGEIDSKFLQTKFYLHQEGDKFAEAFKEGASCIVTTGIGLSGIPHIGTISQIMRAIYLQKAGLKVQFVLGDLDSYNSRNKSLASVEKMAEKYISFIIALGFDTTEGILRTQSQELNVLKTQYLISKCLKDEDFDETEEDLSVLYKSKGVYPGIVFPVKQSILLMIADFVHLGMKENYSHVLTMLGIEEHKYALLAREVIKRSNLPMHLGAIYSKVIGGLGGYSKMSKSLPGSGITVDMTSEEIRDLILKSDEKYSTPEQSVVYQMMSSASYYTASDIHNIYQACQAGGTSWQKYKSNYADELIEICKKWK